MSELPDEVKYSNYMYFLSVVLWCEWRKHAELAACYE